LATNAPLFCADDVCEEVQQEMVAAPEQEITETEMTKKECCGEHATEEEVCASGKCEDCHQ
jgi:hypothetical protein